MKEFRKNSEGHFICEECGKIIKNEAWFGRHIIIHGSKEQYFEKWLRQFNDKICLHCGKETKILKLHYNDFCSKKCAMLYRIDRGYVGITTNMKEKSKETCLKKYGVQYTFQVPEIRKNIHNTCLQLYGNISSLGNTKIREKRKKTIIEKYGVEEYFSTNDFKEKSKQTWLKNYGVENPSQDKEIYEKQQKRRLYEGTKINYFKNSNLWYQASYEKDFLEKNYDKFPDIQRGPSIKYIFDNKNKIYHSDFFIPSLNLVIEIKSLHYYNLSLDIIKSKEKATISNGYNYIIIIDKDYTQFEKIIKLNGITSTL